MTPTRTITRTPTATIPRPVGPEITFFGIATADNRVRSPIGVTEDGVPIYDFPNNFGFIIVLEGRSGTNNRPPSPCGTREADCGGFVGPQIIAGRTLGNGSPAVCDVGPSPGNPIGGVPAVPALTFDQSTAVQNAIADLACRFDVHNTSETACTFDELGNFRFVRNAGSARSSIQFCSVPVVGSEIAFPPGITRLKARIQDTTGVTGNQVEIAIQVD